MESNINPVAQTTSFDISQILTRELEVEVLNLLARLYCQDLIAAMHKNWFGKHHPLMSDVHKRTSRRGLLLATDAWKFSPGCNPMSTVEGIARQQCNEGKSFRYNFGTIGREKE